MKRKRRSVKRPTKKPSVSPNVPETDPGYYSDANKDNDEVHVNDEIETKETSSGNSGHNANFSKSVVNDKSPGTSAALARANNAAPGNAAAQLARSLSSSRANATSGGFSLQRPRIGQKEPKSSRSASAYNKEELDAAELIIKKIMKMDAAIPFNVPVDPIALGIPDYFDIVDAPMDFGTICSKLERGLEYKNSKDVMKDVQLVWDNCSEYNKKGSFILELMKRVKANFMRQWTAAGLYNDQHTVSKGHSPHNTQPFAESTLRPEEDGPMSPVASTIRDSAYLPHHNYGYLNHGQHQPYTPHGQHQPYTPHGQHQPYTPHGQQQQYTPHGQQQQFPPHGQHQHFPGCCTFNPQHMPYPYPGSLHPGLHNHDMVPQHSHSAHLHPHHSQFPPSHSTDPINTNAYNPWANEASANLMHSRQQSPTGSIHPQQRTYLHPSSSNHLPPPRLHPDINSQSTGHMLLPDREPASTVNQHDHAYNLPRHADERNHIQQYQIDSVPPLPIYPTTSRQPAHQLGDNSNQQLRGSPVEVDRNTERAGNPPVAPPVEPSVNYATKRVTKNPRPAFVDDSNFQQLDNIPSTPEQSSSMNNIEAYDLQEDAGQNHSESSPSEKLHWTADSNISKRKGRVSESRQFQEKALLVRNVENPAGENTPQNKIIPLQTRPLPLRIDDSTRAKKKHRGRGPAKSMFTDVERISVNTDEYGQPIGPEAQKLASFLGTLARNGNFLPLTYHDWRALPLENKESMWEKVQASFDIDPLSKDWVLRSLSQKWKNWKSLNKTRHYDPHETDEERLADRDERVLPEQWAALVALWGTDAAQKRSEKNKVSRSAMKYNHATGRKSFARIREEQRAKRPDGKELSRAELFILTRTRKDGKPVNAETSQVIEKLKEREHDQDTPETSNKPGDILEEIIGPNKKGLSRCIELDNLPTGLIKPTRAQAIRMVSQANAEINEMKEKMSFMEQTCAQMAAQMASMMSMMSSMNKNVPDANLPDKNVPDTVPLMPATSDQSVPNQVNTTSSPADPTPQVPLTSDASHQSIPSEENMTPNPPEQTQQPQRQAPRPRGRPRKT